MRRVGKVLFLFPGILFSPLLALAVETSPVQESHPFTLRGRTGERLEYSFDVKSPGEVQAEVLLKKRGQLLQVLLVKPDHTKVRGKSRGSSRYQVTARATSDLVELGFTWSLILINFTDAEEVEGIFSLSYPGESKAETLPPGDNLSPPAPPTQEPSGHTLILTPFALQSAPEQNRLLQVRGAELEMNGIYLGGEYNLERYIREKRVYLRGGTGSPSADRAVLPQPAVVLRLTDIPPGEYQVTAYFFAESTNTEIRLENILPSSSVEISGARSLVGTGTLIFPITLKVTHTTSLSLSFTANSVFFSSIAIQRSLTEG